MQFNITGLITLPDTTEVGQGGVTVAGGVQLVSPIARLSRFSFDIQNGKAELVVLYFSGAGQTKPTAERSYVIDFPILQATQDPTLAAIQAMFDGVLQSNFQAIDIHQNSVRVAL